MRSPFEPLLVAGHRPHRRVVFFEVWEGPIMTRVPAHGIAREHCERAYNRDYLRVNSRESLKESEHRVPRKHCKRAVPLRNLEITSEVNSRESLQESTAEGGRDPLYEALECGALLAGVIPEE